MAGPRARCSCPAPFPSRRARAPVAFGADTLAAAPEVDWVAAKAMRTIIAHEYEDLDVDIVAATDREDLPGMKAAALRLLS